LFQEKAQELAKELAKPLRKALEDKPRPFGELDAKLEKKAGELEEFKASDGWMEKFKQRHSIVFKGNQGEAAEWRSTMSRNRQSQLEKPPPDSSSFSVSWKKT
jgi:hypothetical protein